MFVNMFVSVVETCLPTRGGIPSRNYRTRQRNLTIFRNRGIMYGEYEACQKTGSSSRSSKGTTDRTTINSKKSQAKQLSAKRRIYFRHIIHTKIRPDQTSLHLLNGCFEEEASSSFIIPSTLHEVCWTSPGICK